MSEPRQNQPRQNRWVQEPRHGHGDTVVEYPPNARLEVVYLTDPEIVAEVLPPPLTPAPEPRARVHFTRIEVDGHVHEIVGSFLLDAMYGDTLGQFCAVMPIDLETAVTPSRETYGEPKKLAQMEFAREGNHIKASMARQGVTFIEVVGDVTDELPVPAPYEVVQFWYKFLPAVSGVGFDAGPFLITLHQTVKARTCEKIEGKLVLRDLPGTPVADVPILELESIRTMMIQTDYYHVLEDVEIDPVAYAKHVSVQYQ
jgi:acetoacetate decarboxylase